MSICILDAWDDRDPALLNSHWVAQQTEHALHSVLGLQVATVSADAVTSQRMRAAFLEPHVGFAYFGHGCDDALYRERDIDFRPIPILDGHGVHLINNRWFHAFACLSGDRLCQDAADAGAGAYLGYSQTVTVEWEPAQLTIETSSLLATLVTTATLLLARGERSHKSVRGQVREAADRLVNWLDENPVIADALPLNEIIGIHSLASLLHNKLEPRGSLVTP